MMGIAISFSEINGQKCLTFGTGSDQASLPQQCGITGLLTESCPQLEKIQ